MAFSLITHPTLCCSYLADRSGDLRRSSLFFRLFFAEFAKPGASFSMRQQYVDGDYAYILWSAETADNSYEAATDTFVVRNGKIVAQSFAAKIIPKRKDHHRDWVDVLDDEWDIGTPLTVDAIRAFIASEQENTSEKS